MFDTAAALDSPGQIKFTRRQHAVAVLLFVAVTVVVFWRAIFLGEVLAPVDLLSKELPWQTVLPRDVRIDNFTTADVMTVFYPWKYFVHSELQQGRFPLWCRHVGCGYPLAGEGCIKLFGLTTAFLWISPPRVASILTFSSQLLIAMTGLYVLLCALRVRWWPAVFGALTYGLNSALLQRLEFEHMSGGVMMLPWVCWALWRGVDDRRFLAWAGLFFGLAIINGSLQSATAVWMSAAGFVMVPLWKRKRQGLMAVLTFSIIGVAVGAIALLPNLELFCLNSRARFHQMNWVTLILKRPVAILPALAGAINPDSIGNHQTFDLVRAIGPMGAINWPEMSDLRVYCGLGAFVLAGLGLRSRGDVTRLGIVLVMVPVIVAFLTPLYLILYFRGLSVAAAGIAVLAAGGLDRILNPDEQLPSDVRKALHFLVAGAVLALAVGIVVTVARPSLQQRIEKMGTEQTSFYKYDRAWQIQKADETVSNFTLSGHAVSRFCVLSVLVGLALAMGRGRTLAWSLIALNTLELVEFGSRTVPSVPAAFDYPATPALEFLRAQQGFYRVCSWWDLRTHPPTARQNLLLPYGIDDARLTESLVPRNPVLARQDWSALNVRYAVVPPQAAAPPGEWRLVWSDEVDIYQNDRVQPRVSFTTDLRSGIAESVPIEIEEYVSGHIRVAATVSRAGWLVVREQSYPGWRATVNEQPVHLDKVEDAWLAVPVAPGRSVVRLDFAPASVHYGAIVSVLGLVSVGLLVIRKRNQIG